MSISMLLLFFVPCTLKAQKYSCFEKVINNAGSEIPLKRLVLCSKILKPPQQRMVLFIFTPKILKRYTTISSLGFSTYTLPVSQLTVTKNGNYS